MQKAIAPNIQNLSHLLQGPQPEVSTMLKPFQGAMTTQASEQALAQAELEQYAEGQPNTDKFSIPQNLSFQALSYATETILRHAFFLDHFKRTRSRKEYKQLLAEHGFTGEERKYLKIAAAFQKFAPQDLGQIEPRTIYQLAESKKYKFVIDQLLDLTTITQEAVRSLIKEQHPPKQPKPEKPTIWRRTKNGGRYCQIPPIHEPDERTGTTLQKMMDEEGLSAQQVVAEAVALRQAYKEGRLALIH